MPVRVALSLVATLLSFIFIQTSAASADNVLRWTSQGDALTLDPHSQNEAPTIAMSGSMYERLVNRDPSMALVPELAVSWKTISPTIWEFELRSNVKFHGGEDFGAEDVVFSIARAKAESSNFKEQVASISEVIAVDNLTIQIVTVGANPILPEELTSIFMMDKGWCEEHNVTIPQDFAASEETFSVRHENGTGPFVLESRIADELTILNKNHNWWGNENSRGNIDRIEYRPIKNASTRLASLLSGEVDFLLDPPMQDVRGIESTAGLTTQSVAQIRTIFFGMDIASPQLRTSNIVGRNPFTDVRVRQSMNMALDRQAIQSIVMDGNSVPAGIVASPRVRGYTPELDQIQEQDLEGAKSLLAEAGYPEGFSVQLDCPNDRYVNDASICEAAVAMYAKIGVIVHLEAVSKSIHFPKVLDKTTDFYMLGWGVPTLDSQYVFQYLFDKSGAWNATGFDNVRINEITALMSKEVDQVKRDNLIAEAWSIVGEELPYIPIHHQILTWAMSDRLNLPIAADDIPRFSYATMH